MRFYKKYSLILNLNGTIVKLKITQRNNMKLSKLSHVVVVAALLTSVPLLAIQYIIATPERKKSKLRFDAKRDSFERLKQSFTEYIQEVASRLYCNTHSESTSYCNDESGFALETIVEALKKIAEEKIKTGEIFETLSKEYLVPKEFSELVTHISNLSKDHIINPLLNPLEASVKEQNDPQQIIRLYLGAAEFFASLNDWNNVRDYTKKARRYLTARIDADFKEEMTALIEGLEHDAEKFFLTNIQEMSISVSLSIEESKQAFFKEFKEEVTHEPNTTVVLPQLSYPM
jgi:hypothetical protein